MTKENYIDQAHLVVTGGEITDESSVWRDDLEALLPAAVNYGVMAGVWEQFKAEGDWDMPGSFVGTFENITVDVTGEPFFMLPKTLLPLNSDRGVRMVYTPKGGHVYQVMNDNMFSNWHYYKNIMTGQRFFRLLGTKVKLYNKPDVEDKVSINMIVSTEDYEATDHLPVPVGKELTVIQQLVLLFHDQRSTMTDKVEDQSDIN